MEQAKLPTREDGYRIFPNVHDLDQSIPCWYTSSSVHSEPTKRSRLTIAQRNKLPNPCPILIGPEFTYVFWWQAIGMTVQDISGKGKVTEVLLNMMYPDGAVVVDGDPIAANHEGKIRVYPHDVTPSTLQLTLDKDVVLAISKMNPASQVWNKVSKEAKRVLNAP